MLVTPRILPTTLLTSAGIYSVDICYLFLPTPTYLPVTFLTCICFIYICLHICRRAFHRYSFLAILVHVRPDTMT